MFELTDFCFPYAVYKLYRVTLPVLTVSHICFLFIEEQY